VSEPAVALTDWLLTLECVAFALFLRGAVAGFFASLALASLLGGAVHGFFPEGAGIAHLVLWRGALLALGAAAACAGRVALDLLGSRPRLGLVWGAFAAYAAVVLAGFDAFGIAIVAYLPAVVLLLAGFARAALITRDPRIALAAWGLGLVIAGSAAQQLRIAIHPTRFDHNAVYHLVQSVALLLVFLGARALLAARLARRSCDVDA
jgi:hypothetical protein